MNDGLQLQKILTMASGRAKNNFGLFVSELHWILAVFFQESDMSFVYIDRINGATLAYRDFYGKRSLLLQAKESTEELLFSSC